MAHATHKPQAQPAPGTRHIHPSLSIHARRLPGHDQTRLLARAAALHLPISSRRTPLHPPTARLRARDAAAAGPQAGLAALGARVGAGGRSAAARETGFEGAAGRHGEHDGRGAGGMVEAWLGGGVVGHEGRVLRERDEDLDTCVCGPVEGEAAFGAGGRGGGGL